MRDDEFEPHLGRLRGRGKEQRYLNRVVKAAKRAGMKTGRRGRFDGSRIGRGASVARVLRSRDRLGAFRSRRCIVKIRPVGLGGKGMGGAKAHLRYIQRDGVTREGEPGQLYSADKDVADGKAFLERCDGDRRQFRMIVSAEDGSQYQDLKPFVRRLMMQMEQDLGTRLDWVAVDHFNTGHPHTHIVVRGVNDRGENLLIAREYISHGARQRAIDMVNLDLGPRTDLEIEERLRSDTNEERLTAIDRRLIRDMNEVRLVSASDNDPFYQSLRVGRLQKLGRMGLATHFGGDTWRLEPELANTLRRIGERGDIIRTMQRELTAQNLDRAPADRVIYDPTAEGAAPIVGRVIMRGLADEYNDRHYLLVDGIDGRTHYAEIGKGEAVDPIPKDAIVQIAPRSGGVHRVDHTIVEVAEANGGRYTIDAHLRHDPTAREAFAETHVRRLEAMRKVIRSVEREPDGAWIITPDHLDKVEKFEARQLRDRPVTVETLSAAPVDKLPTVEAATWLDRELVADAPTPVRDAGFGREVNVAQTMRRQWLIAEQLADEQGGRIRFRPDMLAALQRRELLRIAGQLSDELGVPFAEIKPHDRVDGRLARAVELTSGRYALIERSRDFTLVPWRLVLERHIGKPVSGIMREGGISWTFGRQRSGPSIS
ncbi:relaxase/mobilization nuclease RlxS [Novosphingobium mathurense]|uniref:Type IV secretory pathway, VirD2 components (Relaxase) n=1 Tax=Novosphingobium mathurense TaxID=428990 RepID=A0A1U6H630_9SPHN|nr:relaxase/mobilization nuclease RlxS [Novosphingobium mathurense]SLJ91218.1 Type IV secretory pathway, VirD2 components (relaxase) [Novosphingobium mathurense]